MAEKYFHHILGSDTLGDGTATAPYKTYDKARAMAGTDEVWGGGIGCTTWAKIRFCASDGDDANTSLSPDSPKYSFWDVWNANDISASDCSLVVLVKGSYDFSESKTLINGGFRSSTYAGSTKMLRGYSGSDYFGSGKCFITILSATYGLIVQTCDNSVFQNIVLEDTFEATPTPRSLIAVSIGYGLYNIRFIDCDFLNFQTYGFDGYRYMAYMSNASAIGCRFVGKTLASTGAYLGGSSTNIFYGCSFTNVAQPCAGSQSMYDCIVTDSTLGIELRASAGGIWSGLVIANCGTALKNKNASACPTLTNSIIYNCDQLASVEQGQPVLKHCCIWPMGGVSAKKTTGTVTDDCSLIGEGCFVADPQFVDAANGDFRLKSSSPCWNKGLVNPFIAGNVGHLGAEIRPLRGKASRAAVYANSRQIVNG
jgi:hypothetical protein